MFSLLCFHFMLYYVDKRQLFFVYFVLNSGPSTYYRLTLEVGRVSEIAYESVNIGEFKCAVHDRCGRSVAIGRDRPAA